MSGEQGQDGLEISSLFEQSSTLIGTSGSADNFQSNSGNHHNRDDNFQSDSGNHHNMDDHFQSDSGNHDNADDKFSGQLSFARHPNSNRQHDPWWYETIDDGVLDLGTTMTGVATDAHDNNENRSLSWPNGSDNNGTYNDTNGSFGNNQSWFSGLREMMWADPRKLSSMRKSVGVGNLNTVQWTQKHRLHLVMVMLGSTVICSAIAMMNHPRNQAAGGNWRGHQPFQQDLGAATLKTPPSWSHEQSHNYSLRSWLSDIAVWSAATDVEVERQAAAAVLQIHGMTRDLVREIPAGHMRDGIWEGNIHVPGLMLVCRTLAQRFAPLESEIQTRTMSEMMNFQRLPSESIHSRPDEI